MFHILVAEMGITTKAQRGSNLNINEERILLISDS